MARTSVSKTENRGSSPRRPAMVKSFKVIGLYFDWASALQNEFHNLASANSPEAAEGMITEAMLDDYDMVIIVPAYEKKHVR